MLLGVRAVIAESYERIHRSNLLGMGVLPLQFPEGETAELLGLTGEEAFDIDGVTAINEGSAPATVRVAAGNVSFDAIVRIETPSEASYYRHGGIMPYVLRSLLDESGEPPSVWQANCLLARQSLFPTVLSQHEWSHRNASRFTVP